MRVLIVGAGLSGLSLATFLRRVNIDCIVLEQAPFLEASYITPYTLFANALSCFKAYGAEYVFANAELEAERYFGIKNQSGQWLLRLRNRHVRLSVMGVEDAIPSSTAPPANSNSIVSQRLSEAVKLEMGSVPLRTTLPSLQVRETLRRHIPEIKFGCRVVDLAPHDGVKGGVYARLEDGSTEWGDVIVGADGMHSTLRRILYPDEFIGTNSRSLGMLQIDGFVDTPRCPEGLEEPVELWGDRRKVELVPLYRAGLNRIAFSATLYAQPRELIDVSRVPTAAEVLLEMQLLMKREFAGFGCQVPELLSRAALAIPVEVLEVPVMPRWFNRRAVLIGEAAHGSLPSFLNQDASLCVEDAALLATALVDVPLHRDSGYEYAFRQFETVRRDRVERYIRQSRRARALTATPHTTLRDCALRAVPPIAVSLGQQWLSHWSYSAQQLEVDPKIKLETAFR